MKRSTRCLWLTQTKNSSLVNHSALLLGRNFSLQIPKLLYCTVDVSACLPRPSRQSLISLGETEPHIPQDLVAEVRFCLESKIIIYNCSYSTIHYVNASHPGLRICWICIIFMDLDSGSFKTRKQILIQFKILLPHSKKIFKFLIFCSINR